MAALHDFLNALYPETKGLLRLEYEEGQPLAVSDLTEFLSQAGDAPIYAYPVTTEGETTFVFQFIDNAVPGEWTDFALVPSVVLEAEGRMICAWALAEPSVDADRVAVLVESMGGAYDEPMPAPDEASGWVLSLADPDAYHSIESLEEFFTDAELAPSVEATAAAVAPGADTAPWEEEDHGTLLDARLLSPLDLDAPEYAQELVISVGANFKSTKWKNDRMSVAKLIAILARHPVGKQKDGPGFVLGEIVGDNRRKQAITKCYGVGLDIDVGMPGHEIDAALAELGCLALRYTTFSHGKTTSKVNRDKIVKWCDKNDMEFGNEAVLAFLKDQVRWDARLLEQAEYVGDSHDPEGVMACINHPPMEKHRVVLPLAEAFDPTKVAKTHAEGMKMWASVLKALARKLGDLPMDNSAVDPSRLFYFPRHADKRPHETTILGGPLLDWQSLDLSGAGATDDADMDDFDKALAAEVEQTTKTKSRSKTDEGKKLGRWAIKSAHGFQIVDVIKDHADDRIRTPGSAKIDIECPFDEDHSNPGDSEDRGCFAVNAGDGPSEIFTIKCQHDSCQGKTNLDFLGKMLKDDWFSDEVLEDTTYNAATYEDAPLPEAAEKIAREDDARTEYEKLIDALTPDSTDEQVDEAVASYVRAGLEKRAKLRAEEAIKKNLKMSQATFTRLLASVKKEVNAEDNKAGTITDPKGRKVFSFTGDFNFDEAFDLCFKALKDTNRKDREPTFSCAGDKPVRLTRDKSTGRITFDELQNRTLWSELNNRVTFVRKADSGDGVRQAVPKEVGDHVYEQAYTELPQSPEIIYTPLYTANGDLVLNPGYVPELNIIMADTGFKIDVPVDPTAEDALEAVRFLKEEVLIDFPFLDYDTENVERREPSEANCLSMLITPFIRRMISGCTPVFFVAKPVPGTGGTLLGKLPMLIFDGAESAPMRYTQNEEEMQKSLLAAIMDTRSHLFFDDVKDFNNRSLLQSITASKIGGRLLGVSRNVTRPNLFNWVATGNNPIVGAEMERRICWIRLNAKTPDIQNRIFHHPDFPGFVEENRAKIIRAILTMIQYWIDIGAPTFEERKRVSFEDWSRKVGGVLQACGVEGFLDNRRSAAADLDESAVKQFVKEWLKAHGYQKLTASKLFGWATDIDLDIIEGNNDDQKKQRFPKRLHTLDGRAFTIDGDDYMVQTAYDEDQNTVFYLGAMKALVAEAAAEEPIAA